jgi:hypothetical protein
MPPELEAEPQVLAAELDDAPPVVPVLAELDDAPPVVPVVEDAAPPPDPAPAPDDVGPLNPAPTDVPPLPLALDAEAPPCPEPVAPDASIVTTEAQAPVIDKPTAAIHAIRPGASTLCDVIPILTMPSIARDRFGCDPLQAHAPIHAAPSGLLRPLRRLARTVDGGTPLPDLSSMPHS